MNDKEVDQMIDGILCGVDSSDALSGYKPPIRRPNRLGIGATPGEKASLLEGDSRMAQQIRARQGLGRRGKDRMAVEKAGFAQEVGQTIVQPGQNSKKKAASKPKPPVPPPPTQQSASNDFLSSVLGGKIAKRRQTVVTPTPPHMERRLVASVLIRQEPSQRSIPLRKALFQRIQVTLGLRLHSYQLIRHVLTDITGLAQEKNLILEETAIDGVILQCILLAERTQIYKLPDQFRKCPLESSMHVKLEQKTRVNETTLLQPGQISFDTVALANALGYRDDLLTTQRSSGVIFRGMVHFPPQQLSVDHTLAQSISREGISREVEVVVVDYEGDLKITVSVETDGGPLSYYIALSVFSGIEDLVEKLQTKPVTQ